MLSVLPSIFIHKLYVQTNKALILDTSPKHCMKTVATIAHKEAVSMSARLKAVLYFKLASEIWIKTGNGESPMVALFNNTRAKKLAVHINFLTVSIPPNWLYWNGAPTRTIFTNALDYRKSEIDVKNMVL
jgi:hypothetical protein